MSFDRTVLVTEVYPSIQGESTWAGLPCVFICLTGCPLRCRWCDTAYAFSGGERWKIDDLVEKAHSFDIPLVEITGGEPLAQPNCPLLCSRLLDQGKTVLIETAGSHSIDVLPEGAIRIMDLKCPDSGEMERNLWTNIDALNANDEVKFVIASRKDFEWAADVTRTESLNKRVRAVLFSPVAGEIEPADLAKWILDENLPVRFQLQLHKFIWEPSARGV